MAAVISPVLRWHDSGIIGVGPGLWYGSTALDGTAGDWQRAPLGSIYVQIDASGGTAQTWQKIADAGATADWVGVIGLNGGNAELRAGLTTTGAVFKLGTLEPSVVASDVLGRISFYAPLEASGTDAVLVGASIAAIAEASFTATVNATGLAFQTGASETATTKMTLTSAGKLGLGTTTPSGLFVAEDTNPAVKVVGHNGLTDTVEFALVVNEAGDRTYGGYFVVRPTTANLEWVKRRNLVDTTVLTIANSGNHVGIGPSATDPGNINGTVFSTVGLHVKGAGSGQYIAVDDAHTSGVMINNSGKAANARLWGIVTNNSDSRLDIASMSDAAAATPWLTVLRTGYVGINTVAPVTPLHVAGSAYITGNVGAGIAAPATALHVAANESITAGPTADDYSAAITLDPAYAGVGSVTTVTLNDGGLGYTALDVLTVVQSGGASCTVRVDTVNGSGTITAITLTGAGTGYEVANGLATTVAPSGGTGAKINVTVVTACTVTRHNYIDVNNIALTKGAAVTAAALLRFDANVGTHKALLSGTTKTTPTGVDAWIPINANGTIMYMPVYASTTA